MKKYLLLLLGLIISLSFYGQTKKFNNIVVDSIEAKNGYVNIDSIRLASGDSLWRLEVKGDTLFLNNQFVLMSTGLQNLQSVLDEGSTATLSAVEPVVDIICENSADVTNFSELNLGITIAQLYHALDGDNDCELNVSGDVGFSLTQNSLTEDISFNIGIGGTTFEDNRTTQTGIEYSDDYSATYTDRSLVDKAFVVSQVAGGKKVYKALLSQSGTDAPTAIVLENTLGEVLTFAYNGLGEYSILSSSKFTSNKTSISFGNESSDNTDYLFIDVKTIMITTSEIPFFCYNNAGGNNDDLLLNTSILIEVYD